MVQVIEQQGSLAGRLGKGFAKGLSEQLPKEIDTYRLSSGLKKLSQEDFSGKNQFDILSKIYAIPGMTPEIASLAQQQIQKQNFLNRGEGTGKITSNGQKSAVPTPQAGTRRQPQISSQKQNTSEFASPEEISEMKNSLLQEPSYEDEYELAKTYINHGITQDANEAMQFAKQELNQNRMAQQIKNKAFLDDLQPRVSLALHDAGFADYKSVAGDLKKRLIDQGQNMVNGRGMTPEAASEKIEDIITELGKTNTQLDATAANRWRKSSNIVSDLKEQKREYEKYGFGPEFDDLVTGKLKITPLQTAHELDPLKNSSLNDYLSKLKKHKPIIPFDTPQHKMKENDLDQIIRSIKPEDNILAVAYELRDKGYDLNQFKKRIGELRDEKLIRLSKQQGRQLKKPITESFLGDILWQAFR